MHYITFFFDKRFRIYVVKYTHIWVSVSLFRLLWHRFVSDLDSPSGRARESSCDTMALPLACGYARNQRTLMPFSLHHVLKTFSEGTVDTPYFAFSLANVSTRWLFRASGSAISPSERLPHDSFLRQTANCE